jgi:hypothetical protein
VECDVGYGHNSEHILARQEHGNTQCNPTPRRMRASAITTMSGS